MNMNLSAELRPDTGKGVARKLRAAGKIPGVLYSLGTAATPLTVSPTELLEIFRKTRNRNTVVELQVDGRTIPALVQDAQRHPVTREVLHVDFLEVHAGRTLELMVPVVGVGRPAGAALGGRLRLIRREVKTRCAYDKIPESFEIDVRPLQIGDMVKASEIPTPEGVEVVIENDFNVLTVYGKRAAKR